MVLINQFEPWANPPSIARSLLMMMGRQLGRRLSDASCDEIVLGNAFAEDTSSPEKVDPADNNIFKEFFERGIQRYYDPG